MGEEGHLTNSSHLVREAVENMSRNCFAQTFGCDVCCVYIVFWFGVVPHPKLKQLHRAIALLVRLGRSVDGRTENEATLPN